MIPSPQSDFNIPGKSEENREPSVKSGSAMFFDGESVGFHESDLDRMTRAATDIAEPMHAVTEDEKLDQHRLEYGQATVEAIMQLDGGQEQQISSRNEKLPLNTAYLLFYGASVVAYRARKSLGETAESQRN